MLETPDKIELLHLVDILVDGRFDITKKNLMLQFRGSSNQRIIDVKKSLDQGKVVIWDKLNDGQKKSEFVTQAFLTFLTKNNSLSEDKSLR